MIIKCSVCGKEFDKPSHRNQHEKDAHQAAPHVAQPSAEKMGHFDRCEFMPTGMMFGDPITPTALKHIVNEVLSTPATVDQSQPSSQPIEARETVAGAQGDFEAWWKGREIPEGMKAAFFMCWRAALASAQPIEQKRAVLARIIVERDDTHALGKFARIEKVGAMYDLPVGEYPLYTTPQRSTTDGDVRDAALWRELLKMVSFDEDFNLIIRTGMVFTYGPDYQCLIDYVGSHLDRCKSSPPATEAVRKGFWDVYEPGNNKRVYVTVFNSLEADSYRENGYRVVEQSAAPEAGERE